MEIQKMELAIRRTYNVFLLMLGWAVHNPAVVVSAIIFSLALSAIGYNIATRDVGRLFGAGCMGVFAEFPVLAKVWWVQSGPKYEKKQYKIMTWSMLFVTVICYTWPGLLGFTYVTFFVEFPEQYR